MLLGLMSLWMMAGLLSCSHIIPAAMSRAIRHFWKNPKDLRSETK
jgi:hypothetical protein